MGADTGRKFISHATKRERCGMRPWQCPQRYSVPASSRANWDADLRKEIVGLPSGGSSRVTSSTGEAPVPSRVFWACPQSPLDGSRLLCTDH